MITDAAVKVANVASFPALRESIISGIFAGSTIMQNHFILNGLVNTVI